MTFFRLAPLALLLATPAISAAPDWVVDPARSSLGFSGTQTGTHFAGKFTRFKAAITFDAARPETSRIVVVVDVASAVTGDKQRDTALPGKDWFDAAGTPQARFVSSAIRRAGANSYVAIGGLTLRGVTRPVSLPFTLQIDGAQAHARGHLQLVRTAFGVGQGAWASDQWVALEVGVDVDILAKRAG